MNIEIMSRENIRKFSFQRHNEQIAVVSISDMDKESPKLFNDSNNGIFQQWRVHFDDVEKGEENCITDEQALKIVEFVLGVRNRADRIIVNCEAGVSRSAGVGAAIMKFLNNDDWPVFDNPRFCPNMTCYRKVLEAFNVFIDENIISEKERVNIER